MKFLLNTIAMGLTVFSIFSAPLTQAETVASITFSNSVAKADDVSPNILINQQAVQNPQQDTNWKNVPTQFISADGINFAYREYGQQNGGTPVIFLNHLAAVLDNWDPRMIDGIAAKHHVVVFDNRGVGASTGEPAKSIEQMADDAITFIQAKGFKQVDLFGFSMGGMISQEIVLKQPKLIRKMILSGTGPAGGTGISTVGRVSNWDLVRGMATRQDPKVYLFFTRTENGKAAAKAFVQRINERTENRDKEITLSAYRAQLKALKKWGSKKPADLSVIQQPVLVANGDHDRMVPTVNTYDLAKRLPNSSLIIYPDAGHGGIFQFHQDFVKQSLTFLAK
ncbi:alpha/beta hydrolase [Acinetobacter pittii]|mgnify:FL=1|jgi:pimeloyl-ACP methyl ester carboxylesterase|uniref:alpha/beta fold hydrolase n=1 Tax=Acinetobacter pittii TaxID=48296 RepID=UPI0008082E0C|nr:alpha/beta hydrolase [Acinetobacter pittii]MRA47855.1 alpha/beta hydrolase [Acinetobacter pittii]OCA07265.1 alpha/beta hydrolase [Acinetobacter pittii]